jgi:hypothetical protein
MKGILVDDNGELIVNNGSMTIDDVVFQSSALLIAAFTGEMKHAPLLGGNIRKMIHGSVDPFWVSRMRLQLAAIGVVVENLSVNENGVNLEIKE